jgi:hypothetical protein
MELEAGEDEYHIQEDGNLVLEGRTKLEHSSLVLKGTTHSEEQKPVFRGRKH